MSTSAKFLSDYRIILKHFKMLPSMSKKAENFKSTVRKSKTFENIELTSKLRQSTHSYAVLVSAQKELQHLRGLDTGEKLDQSEKVRQMAYRVGLAVPKIYDENDPSN